MDVAISRRTHTIPFRFRFKFRASNFEFGSGLSGLGYACMTPRWIRLWAVSGAMLLSLGCSHFAAGPPSSTATKAGEAAAPAGDSAAKTGAGPADRKEARLAPRDVLAGKSPAQMTTSSTSASASPGGTNEECIIEEEDEEFQAGKVNGKQPALNRALYLCRLSQSYWQRGDLDKAIDTLDQAYALILEVDPGNDPQLLQEKEDLRHTISKSILEIYSSRHVVVNGKRNSIPLIINKHVQDEIDSFTTGRERDFFLDAYRRSGKYRPRMEAALKEAGLPAELSWLPLIEVADGAVKLGVVTFGQDALGLHQYTVAPVIELTQQELLGDAT